MTYLSDIIRQNFNLKKLASTIEIVLGTLLTAAAFAFFIIPQNFAAAGVTGFSTIMIRMVPISLSSMVLLVNVSFLALGIIFVGKEFTAKTVLVSFLFPIMLDTLTKMHITSEMNPILAAICGGVLLGLGAGMIIRSGASSGGFGILAVILNNKTKISIAAAMNLCDAAVILVQAARQPLVQTIYGILVITISAFVVGQVASLGQGEPLVMYFTQKIG